jgi:ribonuclease P protein component
MREGRAVGFSAGNQRAFAFPKSRRILRRPEFVHLNHCGRRRAARRFILISGPNGRDLARLGVAVGRKCGGAVQRNRTKRLLREFFRVHPERFPAGYDFVITAKRDSGALSYRQVEGEIGRILLDEKVDTWG